MPPSGPQFAPKRRHPDEHQIRHSAFFPGPDGCDQLVPAPPSTPWSRRPSPSRRDEPRCARPRPRRTDSARQPLSMLKLRPVVPRSNPGSKSLENSAGLSVPAASCPVRRLLEWPPDPEPTLRSRAHASIRAGIRQGFPEPGKKQLGKPTHTRSKGWFETPPGHERSPRVLGSSVDAGA